MIKWLRPSIQLQQYNLFWTSGSYKDLILVLKIVNDCDCFMLFAKLFQSRIVFGKKDLENDFL